MSDPLADLDFDLGLSLAQGPGRKAKQLDAVLVRELVPADLSADPVQVSKPPAIKELRDSHHALARVLATGTSEGDASIITGYSPSRISILKADPQFKELLDFYRSQSTDVVADFRARMAGMGLDALQELHNRLNDSPDSFDPRLLKEIVKDMADRTGHAPQRGPTSVTQVNVQLGDRMAQARERVKQLNSSKTIDGSLE